MSVKFEEIRKFVKLFGIEKFKERDVDDNGYDGIIITRIGAQTDDGNYPEIDALIVITVDESGEFLSIRFSQFIEKDVIMASEYQYEISKYILTLNSNRKIGRWGLDHKDGDLIIDWSIAIEDGKLTEKQFKRVFSSLYHSLKKEFGPLNRVAETGKPFDNLEMKTKIGAFLMSKNRWDMLEALSKLSDADSLVDLYNISDEGQIDELVRRITELSPRT